MASKKELDEKDTFELAIRDMKGTMWFSVAAAVILVVLYFIW